MQLYEDLKYRGLIKDETSPLLKDKLNNETLTFYIGTDPTASSLHIGHYSSFLISKRLATAGHKPILLIGGATGLIGDPRPTTEREMKSFEEVQKNILALTKQAKEIFNFEVVNNYDWSKDINFIDFLRDYGKYFSLNYMLDKDIIKRRLQTGITYTEFSYMIMQALDFLYLYENKNCTLQVAGSDQWGNITAGVDLIRKKTGKEVYAFTMPLITDENGKKISKSDSGKTLWLDKNKTSSYELYQYFLNTDDSKVIEYLKVFTFLSKEEIENLAKSLQENPEQRLAQKTLAYEVIKDLHGIEEYNHAKSLSEALFKNDFKNLTLNDIEAIFQNANIINIKSNQNIVDMLIDMNVASSKREAREFVSSNAISINGDKIADLNVTVDDKYFLHDTYIIIRKGKKNYFIGKK